MGAPKKGSRKGIPSGAHVGRSQFPEREVCHRQKLQGLHTRGISSGTQPQKNPRHVKASEARQLPGPLKASRTQAGRQSPGNRDLLSFRLANNYPKLLRAGGSGPALSERII